MKLWESPLRSPRCAAVLVGALAALVYANSLLNGFAYDDVHIITENTRIHELSTLPQAMGRPYWPEDYGKALGLWRPVTTGLLGLQYAVSGGNPALFHAVNVVLNALVSALVVLLLAELMSVPAAFVGGLIFAVHPVHVEAVANVVGVAEILPALLFLLACLVHVRGPERTGWGRALGIGALYALAFGAKESAVTLPGAIFLLDAARTRLALRDLEAYVRGRWRVYFVMAAVAGAMLLGRMEVLGTIAHPLPPLGADLLSKIPRIWTLADVWSNYVRLMVFPMDLSSDYSPNVIPIYMGWKAANLVGLVLALSILAGALVAWRRPAMARGRETARTAAFGVVWFIITVSPVANVLFLSGVLLAERTLYVPSVGFAAAAAWLFVRLARERRRVAWAAVTVVVVLMSRRTWKRTPTWRDNVTVFAQMIADYPYSGRSQWVLGDLFYQKGSLHRALVAYRAAIGIAGASYQIITEVSKRLITSGRYETAERLLQAAWHEHPDYWVAPALLAVVYQKLDEPRKTERYARVALALDNTDPVRWHLLSWALAMEGRWKEAARARKGAIRNGEGGHWQQWTQLAYSEALAGDVPAAERALDSARIRPASARVLRQIDSLKAAFRAGNIVLPPSGDSGDSGDPGDSGNSRGSGGVQESPASQASGGAAPVLPDSAHPAGPGGNTEHNP